MRVPPKILIDQKAAATGSSVSACDREPIHVIGHVQPHGFLIALADDWRVSHVSANIGLYSGIAAQDWCGQPLGEMIGDGGLHHLRNCVARLHDRESVDRSFAVTLIAGLPPFDVAVHRIEGAIIIEAEPAATDQRDATGLVRAMIARLLHCDGVADLLRDGAQHVQALTGFDRVMVYRFDADDNGEVVAEALRGHKQSYLGLHYPASDIPAQARALYLRNSFRIVADVAAEPVPLVGAGDPIDQSLSVLRAVSPVHIEYLRNMGVSASLSISIIVDGRLWGLFACHNSTPRLPSFAYRTATELFGQMFSMMLEGREGREVLGRDMRSRSLVDLVKAELAHNTALLSDAKRLGELLFDVVPADGIGISIDGKISSSGAMPDIAGLDAIIDGLVAHPSRDGIAVGRVAPGSGGVDGAAVPVGFLAMSMLRQPRDHILLFRCERLRAVSWAGQPEQRGAAKDALSPRKSFEAWAELVRGTCDPFTPAELRAAEMVRVALLETLVQASATPILIHNGGDHALVVAELNHRVRNILSLIRGLISQTRDGAETAESFIATLDARVQALARAHDQLTSLRRGPALLSALIETEAGAYLGPKGERIRIDGPPMLLQPAAFTTLSLVFHELMTNAAKYGALSDSGDVAVIVARGGEDGDSDLLIDWIERDGPDVSPPVRRGFGSTIIERSVPYDLGGTATLSYEPSGFSARFTIPARHVSEPSPGLPTVLPPAALGNSRPLVGKMVLLVEDSMIIAMDCEDALKSLGAAQVVTVGSVASALDAMAVQHFDFALLDFNLGAETSIAVADALATAGILFAFATGYDGGIQQHGHLNAPVIGKPYGVAQLEPMLTRLGFGSARVAG